MDPTEAQLVTALRSFNRSHTQRIGALRSSFLETGRPLAHARLLFEIGPDGATVLALRRRLGLDSGYVSRILRELERDGVVTVTSDPDDGRRRVVTLTPSGHATWTDLDLRSDRLAEGLIRPLGNRQRAALSEAIASADRLLRVATIAFADVDPRSDDALDAMSAYFEELHRRFRGGFDPGDTLVADAPSMRSPAGAFVVARSDDEVVGCGGVQRHNEVTGEIKRMWVHPDWRGVGLGRRLLARLEAAVAAAGYTRVVLDTNDALTEAITMYEHAGYHSIERYNDNPYAKCWFAKALDAATLPT